MPLLCGVFLYFGKERIIADITTIINRSLSTLGANPIVNLTEKTREAEIVNRYYEESRRSILSECLWTFATVRKVLSRLISSPLWSNDSMNFKFQLPPDIVRIFGVSNSLALWRVEGEEIISNVDAIGIIYVYDLKDTTKFSSSFTDAFADKLALDMSYSVLNSNTETERLLKKYNGVSLPKAMSENAQTGSPIAVKDDLWSNSKYGHRSLKQGVTFG